MEKILKHLLSPEDKIIKYGQLDNKILMELKMTTSLFDYIDIITNYYDNEEFPYFNNWTDIEGMGYGWVWLNYKEKDWHRMMCTLISDEVNSLSFDMDDTLYFVYENDEFKTYHFLYIGEFRNDTVIRFSNNELSY